MIEALKDGILKETLEEEEEEGEEELHDLPEHWRNKSRKHRKSKDGIKFRGNSEGRSRHERGPNKDLRAEIKDFQRRKLKTSRGRKYRHPRETEQECTGAITSFFSDGRYNDSDSDSDLAEFGVIEEQAIDVANGVKETQRDFNRAIDDCYVPTLPRRISMRYDDGAPLLRGISTIE